MPLLIFLLVLPFLASGDPQTTKLVVGCSPYKAIVASFPSTRNSTFSELRSNISNSGNSSSYFATVERPRDANPIYALFLCRDYLTRADCLSCFSAAVADILTCGLANGARAMLDGCFLRYEGRPFFYDEVPDPGNAAVCGNRTDNAAGFGDEAQTLSRDLSIATPKVAGYFAAASRGGVFAVAQCVETASTSRCGDCLAAAVGNLKSCLPDADGRAVDAMCFMRYSNVNFYGSYPTVALDALLESPGGSSGTAAVIGGVAGGVGLLLLLMLVLILILWRRSRELKKSRRGDILGATELRGPVIFRYTDLKSATKNFNEENKLGEGGFGDVYKGVLRNGKKVAVKRMTVSQTRRAKEDFKSEVKLISNVHHRNLVRLLGCSSKGPELLLVYEYMSNSSLDRFLFGERYGTLSWKQRFDIIVGMARGLAYLHNEFHVCIIHRDIKSSNILLDDDFQAKIADFGLARLLPGDLSHLSTRFAGTLGYTAPEYAIHGQLSEKVDTYSYGVVILEVISGRKSNDITLEHETQYLLEWAWNLYEKDELMTLVDKSLNHDEYSPEEVKRVIEIALCCTQSTVGARPTMADVVVLLLTRGGPMLHPARPTFIDAINRVHGGNSVSGSSSSKATVSVTELSAR